MGSSRFGPQAPETWMLTLESKKSASAAIVVQCSNAGDEMGKSSARNTCRIDSPKVIMQRRIFSSRNPAERDSESGRAKCERKAVLRRPLARTRKDLAPPEGALQYLDGAALPVLHSLDTLTEPSRPGYFANDVNISPMLALKPTKRQPSRATVCTVLYAPRNKDRHNSLTVLETRLSPRLAIVASIMHLKGIIMYTRLVQAPTQPPL